MSETIKRFMPWDATFQEMVRLPDGDYVRFDDCTAALATERAAREAAHAEADLWHRQAADNEVRWHEAEARAARLVEELRWLLSRFSPVHGGAHMGFVEDEKMTELRGLVGGEGETA